MKETKEMEMKSIPTTTIFPKDPNRPLNPLVTSNIFSRLCFLWVLPTIKKGYHTIFTDSDLYELPDEDNIAYLADKLHLAWKSELTLRPTNPSLWRALWEVYGGIFAFSGIMGLLESVSKIMESVFLGKIIRFFQVPGEDVGMGYLYATGMSLAVLMHGILHHHYFFPAQRCGQRVRNGLISLMYQKSLHLTSAASFSNGAVINLISNDVQVFETNCSFVHSIWLGPLETIVVGIFLYLNIGIAGLAGLCTFLFYIPLQFWFSRRFMRIRRKSSALRDSRIRMISDILLGIQLIKLSSWEAAMRDIVKVLRGKELNQLRRSARMKATNESLFFSFPAVIATVAFCTYWALNDGTLAPDRVFVSLSLFNIIRLTMTSFFTKAVEGLSDANVSLQRITQYLMLSEISHTTSQEKPDQDTVVKIEGADFMWASPDTLAQEKCTVGKSQTLDRAEKVLKGINLELRMDEVVVVVGPVGCGKSSLCMALLGELHHSSGSIVRHSPDLDRPLQVSFSGQTPWILAGSVRENILFGAKYNEERFREVVRVCSLVSDLDQFPKGDLTYIGERGVTLSGGQRARISLARAIYRQADLYILDDPLSAVDPHVGRHLFSKAILGFLKGKCVVLVTHQLQFIKECHRVLVMEQGLIHTLGRVEEVMTTDSAKAGFLGILKEFAATEETEKMEEAHDNVESVPAEPEESSGPAVEEQAEGKTPMSTYTQFIKYSGPTAAFLFTLMLLVLGQGLSVGADYFLARWTAMPTSQQQQSINPGIFGGLVAATVVVALLRGYLFFSGMLNASNGLFGAMLENVLGSPMSFFHINPHGRILNRFSKDQCLTDELLPMTAFDLTQTLLIILGSMIIVCVANPWVLLALPPILGGFWWLRSVYIRTSRQVKRIESASRSPVYSLLSETLEGLATVRAFGAEHIFLERFLRLQHENSRAGFAFVSTARWLGFNLDMVSTLFLGVAVYATIASRSTQQASLVGLSLSYILQMIGTIQWAIRQSVEVEITFIAVERIAAYTRLPQEPQLPSLPPPNWPSSGQVEFRNMGLTYHKDQAPVLSNISLMTHPNEKIGVVGRTGAGKSSLLTALFRLTEPTGEILIDQQDITKMNLHALRTNIAIIPQEPFLFQGTLRFNLDPLQKHTDREIWSALNHAKLNLLVSSLPHQLDTNVSDNGSNFSVGERQLISLARAILQNPKVLVMDEATANIDLGTDRQLQLAIQTQFHSATVLTIAHRLNTVLASYHRILVLDKGLIVEFDHPWILLQNPNGFLTKMVQDTGHESELLLRDMAKTNFESLGAVASAIPNFVTTANPPPGPEI